MGEEIRCEDLEKLTQSMTELLTTMRDRFRDFHETVAHTNGT